MNPYSYTQTVHLPVYRAKVDNKAALKTKPPPRPEAGYSLYSTDSEDQVATAFEEMHACERILTHLKSKQKRKLKYSHSQRY